VILIAAYAVVGIAISIAVGHVDEAWPVLYFNYFMIRSLWLLVVFGVAHVIYIMVVKRPVRLFAYIRQYFAGDPTFHSQFAAGVPLVLGMPLALCVFTSIKIQLPKLNPFLWDVSLAQWDRWLHGGMDPWQILQPLVGHPAITFVIDLVYLSWFYVLQIICLWQAFSLKRPQLRLQFFLSFLLIWVVLGNVAATVFSSAGPCFYEAIIGIGGPYETLMAYLQDEAKAQYPLWALDVQGQLWQGYLTPGITVGRGISAMPSIHVAMSFLMALLGWRIHRTLGIVLSIYLGLIMIGSVHLGWHYALDGYAGIIGAYAIWRAGGWLVARHMPVLTAAAHDK
jgi:hypothetical protein